MDADTLRVAEHAAKQSAINIDHRIGDFFVPWVGQRFDLIIDYASVVSSLVAEISPWFQGVPCNSLECGILLVKKVLHDAAKHLLYEGGVIFPVISLSAGQKIVSAAEKHFTNVNVLQRKE